MSATESAEQGRYHPGAKALGDTQSNLSFQPQVVVDQTVSGVVCMACHELCVHLQSLAGWRKTIAMSTAFKQLSVEALFKPARSTR